MATKSKDSAPIETNPQVVDELGSINHPRQSKYAELKKPSSDTDDEFCFISNEEKPSYYYGGRQKKPTNEPLRIIDNHFSIPITKTDLLKAPIGFPMAISRYSIIELNAIWWLFGGCDFPIVDANETTAKSVSPSKSSGSGSSSIVTSSPHSAKSKLVRSSMSTAYQMGVSYSKGSPNVSFNSSSSAGSHYLRKKTWREQGGQGRRHDILMEMHIAKARFSYEMYPSDAEQVSRQVFVIGEFEIRDRLAVSNIKKFLYLPQAEKKKNQNMLVVKTLHLRPDSKIRAKECNLRVSMLPLRLNIDQDSLLFLIDFFTSFNTSDDGPSGAGGGAASGGGGAGGGSGSSSKNRNTSSSQHQTPIMMVDLPEDEQEIQARKMVEENLMILMEDEVKEKELPEPDLDADDEAPIFFSNIVFSPAVLISLDYHGKKIELSHGPLAGLLMGLGQLQCSQIILKPIAYRNGILGVDRLISFFLREWLQDIKSHQLSSVLKGVGTMNTFIQLFQGIKDLFLLPIEQYQKDGRFVRGIQLGAQSFTARTALALLEITTKVIYLLQITAETAYDCLSPGPSVRRIRYNRKGKRKRLNPPQDIREGVTNAYHIFKEGVGDTAHTLVEMTALEHDRKGYTGAVGAVLRQIPPIGVKPIVLATQATTNVLGGIKNQFIPDARQESKEKWKDDDE